jgi:hypothetical protein
MYHEGNQRSHPDVNQSNNSTKLIHRDTRDTRKCLIDVINNALATDRLQLELVNVSFTAEDRKRFITSLLAIVNLADENLYAENLENDIQVGLK